MGKLQRHQRHRRPNEPGQRPLAAGKPHDRGAAAAASAGGIGDAAGDGGRWALRCLQAGLLVIACLWIYSPVCTSDWVWDGRFNQFVHRISPKQGDIPVFRDNGGDWLWDDDQLLTANLTVQHRVSPDPRVPPDHLRSLAKLWFDPDGADYFPLSYTALWAQWPFFGMNSPGYHITTILLHITGALLLWRLLSLMKIPGAWFASLIFAIHPICVESVAWVSETKNTLSLVPFMLALIHFVKFDDLTSGELTSSETAAIDGEPARWRVLSHYFLAILFFLVAMFAKTTVVMFPIMIVAYGAWKHGFRIDLRGAVLAAVAIAILALSVLPMLKLLVALKEGDLSKELLESCLTRAGWAVFASLMLPFVVMAFDWWKRGFLFDPRIVRTAAVAAAAAVVTGVSLRYGPWLLSLLPGREIVTATRASWAIAAFAQLTSVALQALFFSGLIATDEAESPEGEAAKTLDHYVLLAIPFLWISAGLGLLTIFYQWSRAIGQETIIVPPYFTEGGWPSISGTGSRLAIAGMNTVFYLFKFLWPVNLLPIYTRWEIDPPKVWQILVPWSILCGLTAWFWSNRGTASEPRWGRHALFALAFFLLLVGPVLGFITISYMRITWAADHFIYLPMIGPLALLVAGVATLFRRTRDLEKPVYIVAATALAAVLAYSSFRYAGVWADEDRLWEHTLSINGEAWQAHNRLGAKKFARGDLDAAHYHFQNSTRLRPDLGETHNNLGTTLSARAQRFAQQGNAEAAKREMDAAIEQFAEATRVTPHVPAIKVNLANALAAAGRFGEAGDNYKELLEREPNNPALLNNYGVALYKQGLNEAAIKQFRRALEIAPDLKDAKESLAVALGEKPDPSKSAEPPPPPPGGRLNLEAPVSPTLNAAPAIP